MKKYKRRFFDVCYEIITYSYECYFFESSYKLRMYEWNWFGERMDTSDVDYLLYQRK